MKKTLCIFSSIFLVYVFLGAAEIIVTSPAAGANWCQRSDGFPSITFMLTWGAFLIDLRALGMACMD